MISPCFGRKRTWLAAALACVLCFAGCTAQGPLLPNLPGNPGQLIQNIRNMPRNPGQNLLNIPNPPENPEDLAREAHKEMLTVVAAYKESAGKVINQTLGLREKVMASGQRMMDRLQHIKQDWEKAKAYVKKFQENPAAEVAVSKAKLVNWWEWKKNGPFILMKAFTKHVLNFSWTDL